MVSLWASLVAQRLKRLPGMRETWVRSLGWEDPLEKEMATHSSTLAWRVPFYWMWKRWRVCVSAGAKTRVIENIKIIILTNNLFVLKN